MYKRTRSSFCWDRSWRYFLVLSVLLLLLPLVGKAEESPLPMLEHCTFADRLPSQNGTFELPGEAAERAEFLDVTCFITQERESHFKGSLEVMAYQAGADPLGQLLGDIRFEMVHEATSAAIQSETSLATGEYQFVVALKDESGAQVSEETFPVKIGALPEEVLKARNEVTKEQARSGSTKVVVAALLLMLGALIAYFVYTRRSTGSFPVALVVLGISMAWAAPSLVSAQQTQFCSGSDIRYPATVTVGDSFVISGEIYNPLMPFDSHFILIQPQWGPYSNNGQYNFGGNTPRSVSMNVTAPSSPGTYQIYWVTGWDEVGNESSGSCGGATFETITVVAPPPIVDGSCGGANNVCNSGSLNDTPDSATEYLWQCLGAGGGQDRACSLPKPGSPIVGRCGQAVNSCDGGTLNDTPDSSTHYEWQCLGQNGGGDAFCSLPRSGGGTPTNGQCGLLLNSCNVGTLNDTPDSSTHYEWQCLGLNGGSPDWCSLPIPVGTWGDINAPDCVIQSGASTCSASITWTTTNAGNPTVYHDGVVFSNSAASSGHPRTLRYGSNNFHLYNGGTFLDSDIGNARCVTGTTWNGSICTSSSSGGPTLSAGSCIIEPGMNHCAISISWTSGTLIKYTYTNPGPGIAYNGTQVVSSQVEARDIPRNIHFGNNNVFWNDTGSGANPVAYASAVCRSGSTWNGLICATPPPPPPPPPPTPVLNQPVCNGDNTITVSWPDVPGATRYGLIINDPTNDLPTTCRGTLTDNWYCSAPGSTDYNGWDARSPVTNRVVPGTMYSISLYAVVGGVVTPSAVTNVRCVPDLQPSLPTVSTPSVPVGGTITFNTGNIWNRGNAIAFSYPVGGFYIDNNNDGRHDYYRGAGTVGVNTPAGGSNAVGSTWTVPLTSPIGTYRVSYIADLDDAIGAGMIPEMDERNNFSGWRSFEVTPAPGAPDVRLRVCDRGGANCTTGTKVINPGDEVELTWDSSNAASCTEVDGPSDFSAQTLSGTDNTVTEPVPNTTERFAVRCQNRVGATEAQVFVYTNPGVPPPPLPGAPTLIFTGNPLTITAGQNSTLTWTVTGATSCFASNGWNGWKAFSGTNNEVVTPPVTTTYDLECWNASSISTGRRSVTIDVLGTPPPAAAPEVELRVCDRGGANCTTGTKTINPGDEVELQWNSRSAVSCTETDGPSDFSARTLSGTDNTVTEPTANTSRRFAVRCTNAIGSTERAVFVRAEDSGGPGTPPGPVTLTFRACDQNRASNCVDAPGTKSVLINTPISFYWVGTNVDACTAVTSPADFTTGGSIGPRWDDVTASPVPASTNYTVACSWRGTTVITKTITIETDPRTPELTATPLIVEEGGSVRLDWDTNNGDEGLCSLTGGTVNLNPIVRSHPVGTPQAEIGSTRTDLMARTTFVLVCPAGVDTVTVDVRPKEIEE